MKRVLTLVAIVSCLLAVVVAGSDTSALAQGGGESSRVVLVLAPYTSWADIDAEDTPFLYSMLGEGAAGNMNLRNRGRLAEAPSSTQGALTFSSGSWAAEDPAAPSAHGIDEYYEGGSAAEAFRRMSGASTEGYEVFYLGMPRTARLNESAETLDVSLGAIGQTIDDAGGASAAIGNSDSGYEVRGLWRSRPAPLVAMDDEGRVRFGEVSTELLRNDTAAPYGFSTDLDVFEGELDRVSEQLDDVDGPGLIVLDPGDTQRAADFAPEVSDEVAEEQRRAANRTLDAVASMARDSLPADGVLIVAPQVNVGADERLSSQFGPVLISGTGYEGYLSSSSTQRQGIVTNLDMAPTVLGALGLEAPVAVLGNPMVSDGSADGAEARIDRLTGLNDTAVAINEARQPVANAFIAITTLTLIGSTIILLRAHHWPPAAVRWAVRIGTLLLLLVLTVPASSTLMFLLEPAPTSSGMAVFWLGVTMAILFALALIVRKLTSSIRLPVMGLSLATALIILVDQWVGAPWSFTGFLGYSPLAGARYYGLGNEGAALLVGSVLVGVGLLFDERPDAGVTSFGRRWVLPVLGLVVVATSAAPFLGANVGVAVWGVAAFVVAWALMNGYRLGWRMLIVGIVVIGVLLAAFSVVDLVGGDEGTQTHLGRAWESAGSGGAGELWLIVVRKAETNLRVLTHTNWSYLLVAVLAFLGFMRWRPQGDFAATLEENPYLSDAMAACLVGSVAAYFTEDSGIVIPAMIMLYVGVAILYVMLERLCGPLGLCAEGEKGEAA